MSVNAHVNFFKCFDYPDNLMGMALLGPIAGKLYIEIIIREDGDRENRCSQFHAYQQQREFEKLTVNSTTHIKVKIIPHTVVDDRRIWLVNLLERLKKHD